MKAYEITFSPTGGTQKTSDIIMKEFLCPQERISLLPANKNYGSYTFTQHDICVIAVPSFGGRVPETAVNRILAMNGNNAKTVLVCSYGNRAYEDTLLELKNTVKQAGFFPIAAITAVTEHSIMRQFAAGRPDTKDTTELKSYAKTIWNLLISKNKLTEVTVPGNEPYRAYGSASMKPYANENCTHCGACAKECPVAAINILNPDNTEASGCISCMRCISVCPQNARMLNPAVLSAVSQKMAKAFETRKKNELFMENH